MRRKLISIMLSSIMIAVLVPQVAFAYGMPFSDVSNSAWYQKDVQYVYDNGIMNGVENTAFAPDDMTTRAMVVTMLYRIDRASATGAENSFSDVPSGRWYSEPINWAAANGIVDGIGDGLFAPDNVINREQMATIMHRYAVYKNYDVSKANDLAQYSDMNSVSSWAVTSMSWANGQGLITGITITTLEPQGTATRAQVAAILTRFIRGYKNDSSIQDISIRHFDVGQGDSILIDAGAYEVLIDASTNAAADTVVANLNTYVEGNLEVVIATHPDADHIGGMDEVFSSFQIERIIDSGAIKTTQTFQKYWNAVQAEPDCSYEEDNDIDIGLPYGAVLHIIETGDGRSDPNSNSVICELEYGTFKELFTGDMTDTVEKENLGRFEDIDVLKVGHHGSSTSTCSQFLNVVRPEYSVISYGYDNTYNHPREDLLSRLFAIGSTVFGTAKDGNVTCITDGTAYRFNTSYALTSFDAGGKTPDTTEPDY